MPENLKSIADLASAFASLGIITIFLALLKRGLERRGWRKFKKLVSEWIDELRDSEDIHPRELEDNQWQMACEKMLFKSEFSPLEIQQLLSPAVVVAQGIAEEKDFI